MKVRATQRARQRNIDVIVALVGMVAGIGISSLNIIRSNEYLITMGPMLAVVCLGYVVFRRKLLGESPSSPSAGISFVLTLNIIFWLSFAASLYSLSTESLHRSLIYFLLTSLSAAMIALQILYCRGKGTAYLVVFEILIVSLSVRASAFWVFPTIPGVDSWWHLTVVKDYIAQGHILPYLSSKGGENHYYSMPMMHLNVAIMQLMSGVDLKTAMFLGAGLPLLLSTIFVFLIGRSLGSTKIGLLAMLLVSLSDYHIMWSAENIIAMSFGLTLFTIILYLLTLYSSRLDVSISGLYIMLLMILVLTHTISSFIMACFLIAAAVGCYMYKFLYHDPNRLERVIVTPTLVELFIMAELTHAMYLYTFRKGVSFLDAMIIWFYASISEQAALLVTRAPAIAVERGWLGPILNISGYLLLLFWGILGCLLWLSWQHRGKAKLGLIAALVVLIGLPLSFPLFGISNIEPERWPAFYYVILSVPVATSILTVFDRITNRTLRNLFLSCLVFGFSFLMITNSVSNTDSPIYAEYLNEKLVFSPSEMAAAEFVAVYEGGIVTDGRYGGLALLSQGLNTGLISDRMLDEGRVKDSLVIWRNALNKRPAQITAPNNRKALRVLGESYRQDLEKSHDLIYRNGDTEIFLPKNLP